MKILFIDTLYRSLLSEKGHFNKSSKNESYDSLHEDMASQGFSSGYFYSRELSNLGIDSTVIYVNSRRLQDAWAKENKAQGKNHASIFWKYWQIISRLPLIGQEIHNRSEMIRILVEQIDRFKPDYIYNLDLNFLSGKLVRKLKSSGFIVLGQIASPLPPFSFYEEYDHIFSAHPLQVAHFQNKGISSSWLPLAIDNEITREFDLKGWPDRFRDVTFIGSFGRLQRNTAPLLREIAKLSPTLEIFTLSSKKKLRRLGLASHYKGKAWGKNMLRIFAESKVVINRHGKVAAGFAVNYRLFEATGMGALVVTESAPNMSKLFDEATEIITYDSNRDASEKIENILKNFDDHAHVASAGQLKTITHHTFSSRAKEMLSVLEGLEKNG